MVKWLIEGLKEIGLSLKEYNSLSNEDRKEVDKLLREIGHA